MKVREVIGQIEADDWYFARRGGHSRFCRCSLTI